jgi:hypothetical protein
MTVGYKRPELNNSFRHESRWIHYDYLIIHHITMSRAPSNPFYAGESNPPPSGGSSGPPAYRASNRPVPPTPAEPVSYTSLSDLTKGKQQKTGTNTFSYQPSSQRAGYREGGPVQTEPVSQGTRRLPPDPQAHRDRSLVPPQRNVAGQYSSSFDSSKTDEKVLHHLLKQHPQPATNLIGRKHRDMFQIQFRQQQ